MFFSKHLLQSHEHVTQLAVLRYLEGKDVGHKPHTRNGVGGGGGGGVVFCGVRGERTENLEVCAPRREPTARPVK